MNLVESFCLCDLRCKLQFILKVRAKMYMCVVKNSLGRLWLAYTELQGGFYMLQLTTDDSAHFTQPELRTYIMLCCTD